MTYTDMIKELREKAKGDAQREEKAYWETDADNVDGRVHLAMKSYHNGFYEGLSYAIPLATALDKQYVEQQPTEFTPSKGKVHFITNEQLEKVKEIYMNENTEDRWTYAVIEDILGALGVHIEGVTK